MFVLLRDSAQISFCKYLFKFRMKILLIFVLMEPFWNDNWNGFPVEELPQVANTAMPNTFITIHLEINSFSFRQKLKKKKRMFKQAICLVFIYTWAHMPNIPTDNHLSSPY